MFIKLLLEIIIILISVDRNCLVLVTVIQMLWRFSIVRRVTDVSFIWTSLLTVKLFECLIVWHDLNFWMTFDIVMVAEFFPWDCLFLLSIYIFFNWMLIIVGDDIFRFYRMKFTLWWRSDEFTFISNYRNWSFRSFSRLIVMLTDLWFEEFLII